MAMNMHMNSYTSGTNHLGMSMSANSGWSRNAGRWHQHLLSQLLDRHPIVKSAILSVACLQIISGAVAIGIWSFMLANGAELSKQPSFTTILGIFTGGVAVLSAVSGLVSWRVRSMKESVRANCFILHFGLSIVLAGATSHMIRFSISDGTSCWAADKSLSIFACFRDEIKNLMYVNLAAGSIMLLTALIALIYFIYIICVELPKARRAALAQHMTQNQPQNQPQAWYNVNPVSDK